jgi:NADPH:quinone reductase-like Zn-dependent oxidoreductase
MMARKVVYEHSGDPAEVVRVIESDEPAAPQRGQVLVRVTAFSVHPGDLVGIAGPFAGIAGDTLVPGAEATGTVEAIGPDTTIGPGVRVGARVTTFLVTGAWQDWVLAPSELVVAVPDAVPDAVAAQLMINPLTAVMLRRATERTIAIGYNGVAVQTAAGSSVARLVAVQMVRHPGALINLVRSHEGAEKLKNRLPQVPVVVTSDTGWQDEVRSIANGRPITAALDAVAGEVAPDLLDLLAPGGSLLTYGALARGPMRIHANSLLPKGLRVQGLSIGRWSTSISEQRRAWDIAAALSLGRDAIDQLDVAAVYTVDDVREAIRHVRRPGKTGMVIVTTR